MTQPEWERACFDLGLQALKLFAACPACKGRLSVGSCCLSCGAVYWAAQMLCSPAEQDDPELPVTPAGTPPRST